METQVRRQAILERLQGAEVPLSASALAGEFSVSRQAIVGDIALLRAAGNEIDATPRGYLLRREQGGLLRQVACVHTQEDMGRELEICVDNGCTVLDVVVEHPVYGQLTGLLQISSRYDIRQFLEQVERHRAKPLSVLTEGVHLHTLRCPDEAACRRVTAALEKEGFLWQE